MVKSGSLHWFNTVICSLIHIQILSVVPRAFFFWSRIQPRIAHCSQWSCLFSFLWFRKVLESFQKSFREVYYRSEEHRLIIWCNVFWFKFIWCFLVVKFRLRLEQKCHRSDVVSHSVHPIRNSSLMLTLPVIEDKLVFLNKLKSVVTLTQSSWGSGSAFCSSFHSYLSLSTIEVLGQWAWADFIWNSIQVDLKGVSHGGDRKQVAEAMTFLLHNWKQTWSPSIPLVTFDGCVRALSCNQLLGFSS